MGARYLVVDVFSVGPLTGNALAVFPDPGSVPPERMQAVARELNLSETTFVTRCDAGSYDVRIFTPYEEMPFAGHPTPGTAWALARLGAVGGARVVQRSAAGETPVSFAVDAVWFERAGKVGADRDDPGAIAAALRIAPEAVGFDAAALGMERARLAPATSDAGVEQLMVPLADPGVLASMAPSPEAGALAHDGVYCFAPEGRGRVKARFFASGLGISEDPATGSAAAALGLYLADRAGDLSFEIAQGAEIRRPSRILAEAARGRVRIGGAVVSVAEGTLAP